MKIRKIKITNFKCYKGEFELLLHNGLNVIVGNNESGKSTILEAIHLVLTGILNGRYLKGELSQYLFNNEVISEYLSKVNNRIPTVLPVIEIELFLDGDNLASIQGDNNSEKIDSPGIKLKICFNNEYQKEYEELLKAGILNTLPIEYYDIQWSSFAWSMITSRSIPLKSALIDSANNRFQNGSDLYISRIIKDNLDDNEIVSISQAYRQMKDGFMNDDAIKKINSKIQLASKISNKEIQIAVDLSTRNAWETTLTTYLDSVPFHQIGKGEQCIVKTKLALSHKKAQEAGVILLEEPENHLSHTKLNELVSYLKEDCNEKQVIISTHSSFVANKLNLSNLILIYNQTTTTLDDLSDDTKEFFEKLSGYDTLRLVLCERAILVEGDSDELVVQKAYMQLNQNLLPIERNIEVISVGTAFLRFLEIAEKLNKKAAVVTDNDGDIDALNKKYELYIGENAKENIKICFDDVIDSGEIPEFNFNTLEPKLLKANGLQKMNTLLNKKYDSEEGILKWMKSEKTETALKIFKADEEVIIPNYILDSLQE